MKICVEVTSPIAMTVLLPGSGGLAEKLLDLNLRPDLVRTHDDRLHIHNLFGQDNRVPDVDRYRIIDCEPCIAVRDHQLVPGTDYVSEYPYVDQHPAAQFEGGTLVIVLESPHRDEFGTSIGNPITPARGRTGAGIHRYLSKVLNSRHCLTRLLRFKAPLRAIMDVQH